MLVQQTMDRFGYVLDVKTFYHTAQKIADAFNFLDPQDPS